MRLKQSQILQLKATDLKPILKPFWGNFPFPRWYTPVEECLGVSNKSGIIFDESLRILLSLKETEKIVKRFEKP